MTFENLDQVKREFHLSEDDPKEIKKRLTTLLANLHPDKHGGEDFASPEDKEQFLRINEAIEFIESPGPERTTAIVPANEMTELVKLVRDLVLVDKAADNVANFESRLSERIEQGISEVGRQYLAPRITVSTITAVLTFVWLIPGTISEHPVLKNYISVADPRFLMIWLLSLAVTIVVLYGTSISEDRQKRFQSRLKSEKFQNDAFHSFVSEHRQFFTKSDFVQFLISKRFDRYHQISPHVSVVQNFLLQLAGRAPLAIDPESAQMIADIVFERAGRRGIIHKDERFKGLEEFYSLAE